MPDSGKPAALAVLLAAGAGIAPWAPAAGAAGPHCAQGAAARNAMLASEYAFADRAHGSVRGAFLEYLAEDALVLNPEPVPARPVYRTAPDSNDRLEWYPSVGDTAPSGDLGFTGGPWVFTAGASGTQGYGHFVTVWRQDANCRWRVEFDGGISHAAPATAEPKLIPDPAPSAVAEPPPATVLSAEAPARTIDDFETTARRDGLAAALRTYARDEKFIFFTDQQLPASIGPANIFLSAHPVSGVWRDSAHGGSADATLMYSVGELINVRKIATHAYLQIWQYDPKVANWGLRLLLLRALPLPKEKS